MKNRMFKRIAVAIAALFAVGVLTGTAAAVLTSDSGGAEVHVDKRTNNVPSFTRSTSFVDLPGANVLVRVPKAFLPNAAWAQRWLAKKRAS